MINHHNESTYSNIYLDRKFIGHTEIRLIIHFQIKLLNYNKYDDLIQSIPLDHKRIVKYHKIKDQKTNNKFPFFFQLENSKLILLPKHNHLKHQSNNNLHSLVICHTIQNNS